jgi:imidazole glycerol-phosphate synthase subunit HisH
MIGLINLGNSNIQSVINALDFLEVDYFVTDNYKDLNKCSKIILPGVGSFSNGISRLRELKLFDGLKSEVLTENKPILGICLGMQMFFDSSEESDGIVGLGLVCGKVVRLPVSNHYKIPRIGWSDSQLCSNFLGLTKGQLIDLYYVHSFHAQPDNLNTIVIDSDSGIVSAIKYKNIYGCQFHPEKSFKSGLRILEEFSKLQEKR